MPLGLATDGKEAGCRILRQFDGGPATPSSRVILVLFPDLF